MTSRAPHTSTLRPATAVSTGGEPERISLWLLPLVAYLAVGTLLLFAAHLLERLACYVAPGHRAAPRWHEASAGWIAIYPITVPLLLVWAGLRFLYASGVRAVHEANHSVRWMLRAAGAVARRVRVALSNVLHAALLQLRTTTRVALARVRAVLSGILS